jgi:hypothetical protein
MLVMRDCKQDKRPVPEGYVAARCILGYDEDKTLRIVDCDEFWEPYDYDTTLFEGTVQRLVFYRKKEELIPEPVQYFMVSPQGTLDPLVVRCDDQEEEADELEPFRQDPSLRDPFADESMNAMNEPPAASVDEGEIHLYDYSNFAANYRAAVNHPPYPEIGFKTRYDKKGNDELIREALKKGTKSPFDK